MLKFFLFFLFFYFVTSKLQKDAQLKFVFITHRHGERTLATKYPNDPYLNSKFWPDGDTELTIQGKLRMYNLGLYFKERFKNFITINPREVEIHSSGTTRCLESTQMIAHALYPPKGRWLWKENLDWQPIPISSTVRNTDPMLNPHSPCKMAFKERAKILSSDLIETINQVNRDLFEYLTPHVGIKVKNFEDAKAVYDVLVVEKTFNYTTPEWATKNVLERLKTIYDQAFYFEFSTKKAQMFRTGIFLNEIKQQILDRGLLKENKPREINEFVWDVRDDDNKKLFIYSTHDVFISALLTTLENFDLQAPPYGSTVFFEVYQNNVEKIIEKEKSLEDKNKIILQNTFIKTYYLKHTETNKPTLLSIPDCESKEYCTYKEFFDFLKDITISKELWYKKCDQS